MSSSFADLGVPSALLSVLSADGITSPTPIQSATLPDALSGRDVLGRGRTGSGKTYAFSIPLVARLAATGTGARRGAPRALVLAPTRELARQIDETLAPLAKAAGLSTTVIFGGVPQGRQVAALNNGVDIVVACPGRLEDLMSQKHCALSDIEITVLDEADHMADLGFLPGVKRILAATPSNAQRLLFSATLDRGIDALVKRFLSNPVTHSVDDGSATPGATDHHMFKVDQTDRVRVIADLASASPRTVVFTRTKRGARHLARKLSAQGRASVDLHGNLSQNARVRNLEAFSSGEATVLVATDIAARGIHVDDVGLVIHSDPPAEHKAYVHRSGRTARAGAVGTVVTIATSQQVSEVRTLLKKAGVSAAEQNVSKGSDVTLGDTVIPASTLVDDVAPSAPASRTQPSRKPNNSSGGGARGQRGQGGNRKPARSDNRGESPGEGRGEGRGQGGRYNSEGGRGQQARRSGAGSDRRRSSRPQGQPGRGNGAGNGGRGGRPQGRRQATHA